MSAAVDLSDALGMLVGSMRSDPAMLLAVAGEWLDPLYQEFNINEDWECYEGVEDAEFEFLLVRGVCRTHFPEIYGEFNYVWHHTDCCPDTWLVGAINAHIGWHGEIWGLEEMPWVPHYWLGAGRYSEWFYDESRVAFIARLLLLNEERDLVLAGGRAQFNLWTDDRAESAAIQFDDCAPRPVEVMMQWLFGRTGNTVLDMTNEEAGENGINPPEWDEYETFKEIYSEADDLLGQAMVYVRLLEQDDAVFTEFCSNLLIAYAAGIQKDFYDPRKITPRFNWDAAARECDTGETDRGAAVLPARDYSAAA